MRLLFDKNFRYTLEDIANKFVPSYYKECLFNIYVSTDNYNYDVDGVDGNLQVDIRRFNKDFFFYEEYLIMKRKKKLERILNENS